ncbi:MAG: hypothetical protein WBZ36_12995 [Candidatus Nitrosopolaris sp.]
MNKKYVGKSLEDFRLRKIAKAVKLKPSLLIRYELLEHEASKGNTNSTIPRQINCLSNLLIRGSDRPNLFTIKLTPCETHRKGYRFKN